MNLVGGPAPGDPQIPPLATEWTRVPSPWPRHHADLAPPGGSAEALSPAPRLPRGDGDRGWDGEGVPCPAPPSAFLFPNAVGPKATSGGWAGGRGGRASEAPSSLSPSPDIHLSPAALCPRAQPGGGGRSRACPAHGCQFLHPAASSGRVARAQMGGRRHPDSCHSLQAGPVLPLCPQGGWERRGRTGRRGGSSLKRLPCGPRSPHRGPQARGLSAPAF